MHFTAWPPVTLTPSNGLDMVTSINYNGGKQASYQYNATGDLVEMNDWTGKTSFEVDLPGRRDGSFVLNEPPCTAMILGK